MKPSELTEPLTPGTGAPLPLKLVVVAGPDFGVELKLEKGTYRIGKDGGNDLVLGDSAVSRVHLLAAVLQDGVRFTDNQSTNGSFCEGMRFTTLEAKPGARVKIGRTVLEVALATAPRRALPPSERTSFGRLLGKSLKMRELFTLLERIARSDADVLIEGETGTGKELCAEAIHEASARARGPLVVCDLAGVAPTLFESELFGHVKGAFTGAQTDRAGAFERAHGGTLFLDEVGEIPLEIQPRLLRALEQRQVKRVGGNDYRRVDVRIIAATHRDLEAAIKAGKFRQDLYHRLAVARVSLPPLRERREDIPELIDAILSRMGKEPSQLTAETRAALSRYDWPGNVRELRNVVERAASLGVIPGPPTSQALPARPARTLSSEQLGFKEAKEQLVEAFERDYLADLLQRCQGNVSRAAREAGIDRVYLRRLIRKHGLDARSIDDRE